MVITSIHELLTQELSVWQGHAHLIDATTRGTEELLLLLSADAEPEPTSDAPAGNTRELHVMTAFSQPLFWSEPSDRKKPYRGTGFGDWIRTQLRGSRLERVSCGDSGRVLLLRFAPVTAAPSGSGTSHRLSSSLTIVLDPLPNACRILVLDDRRKVVQRFPPTLHQAPTGRGAPGSTYQEPEGSFQEPWERMGVEPRTALRPDTALYVCEEQALQQLILSPIAPDLLPGNWIVRAGPTTAGRAVQALARDLIHSQRIRHARRELQRLLKTERKQLQRLAKRVEQEVAETARGGLLRRQAEALLAQSGRIPRGSAHISIADLSDPDVMLDIALDPARSLSDNINAMFQKAGRLDRARPIREAKAAHLVRLVAKVGEWQSAVSGSAAQTAGSQPLAPILQSIQNWLQEATPRLDAGLSKRMSRFFRDVQNIEANLDRPHEQTSHAARKAHGRDRGSGVAKARTTAGGAGDAAARLGIHPRRFILDDGWVVWVGRSNRENDLLTHKLARPHDLWFHARGVAGSHVVLQRGGRKNNPGEAILEATAGIAAYYSKARTSGLVPVIYTERRYVRKPRKAPPGLAACLREKVLLVEPKLPAPLKGTENDQEVDR